jgi:hypothetical protein
MRHEVLNLCPFLQFCLVWPFWLLRMRHEMPS